MKDNKLEVGDKVYRWHGSFDSYLKPYEVVRLTPKRAILNDGTQVLNDLSADHYLAPENLKARIVGESYGTVILANDRLSEEYNNQMIRNKAKRVYNNLKIKELSIEKCAALISLFPELLETT